tara:strand:+ start:15669 stop:16472 length:804 start_codon:yes stop_codon:yes gene_type:complete
VLVSAGAASLCAFSSQILFYKIELSHVTFIFFCTLFAYNLQRKIATPKKSINYNQQDQWLRKNARFVSAILMISALVSCYFIFYINLNSIWFLILFGALSFFYVKNLGSIPNLRSLPFLKVFIVGFVWGGATVFLPSIFNSNLHLTWQIHLYALSIACFVFGESLPFDIRDMNYDHEFNLKTIPQTIGTSNTLKLSFVAFGLAFAIQTFLFITDFISFLAFLSFASSLIISALICNQVNEKRPHLFYSLILESTLILPFTIYFIISL